MLKKEITWKNFWPNRDTYIINECRDKKVLHIGPTDWPYTQRKLNNGQLLYKKIDAVCAEQLGIDLDEEGANLLNSMPEFSRSSIVVQDFNKATEIDFSPEIIIFGETLEHLMNHEIAINTLKNCMRSDTTLLISVPNAVYIGNFIYALLGAERQHPDHSVAWTYKTLTQFLRKVNLKIDEVKLTHLPVTGLNWKGKIMHSITYPFARIFPLLSPTLLVKVSLE